VPIPFTGPVLAAGAAPASAAVAWS